MTTMLKEEGVLALDELAGDREVDAVIEDEEGVELPPPDDIVLDVEENGEEEEVNVLEEDLEVVVTLDNGDELVPLVLEDEEDDVREDEVAWGELLLDEDEDDDELVELADPALVVEKVVVLEGLKSVTEGYPE